MAHAVSHARRNLKSMIDDAQINVPGTQTPRACSLSSEPSGINRSLCAPSRRSRSRSNSSASSSCSEANSGRRSGSCAQQSRTIRRSTECACSPDRAGSGGLLPEITAITIAASLYRRPISSRRHGRSPVSTSHTITAKEKTVHKSEYGREHAHGARNAACQSRRAKHMVRRVDRA